MTKIGINGARGRMGQELCQAVINTSKGQIASLFEISTHPDLGRTFFNAPLTSHYQDFIQGADVIIDFTAPDATLSLLEENKAFKKPLVIGTTGLNEAQISQIHSAAKQYPIVFSPNYSIGVNLLFNLLEEAGRVLSKEKGYDLEITELHHRFKKDSPSGTALKLAEIAAKASGRDLKKDGVYGREGIVGERTIDEVGVFAVRAGDIVGEHTVMFCALGERIELSHKAHSRQTFAKGAAEAALWVISQKAGLYTMKDVLGL